QADDRVVIGHLAENVGRLYEQIAPQLLAFSWSFYQA
ncbi:hypothetical protein PSYPI_48590, partial [Pseudomonas syringae pv. pisi str. 1704B]